MFKRSSLLLMVLMTATACSSHLQSGVGQPIETKSADIVNGAVATSTDLGVSSTVGILETDDMQLDANGQITALGNQRIMCTGVLIAPDTVLTAAHCERSDLKYQFIIFSRDITNWSQDQIRQVWQAEQEPTWVAAHSGQTMTSSGVDLAVLRFKGKVPAGYAPVAIYEGQPLSASTSVRVFGYGTTDLNATGTAGILRSASLAVIDPPQTLQTIKIAGKSLTDANPTLQRSDQFNLPSTQSGICLGDSGGPVYRLGQGSQMLLVGITSETFGSTSPTSNFQQCHTYSIHTYVFPHEQWIANAVVDMRAHKKVGALGDAGEDTANGGGQNAPAGAVDGKKPKKIKSP